MVERVSSGGASAGRSEPSWHGVELRHLTALQAVAAERSFSAAAVRLGYTQPAVSGQILALERLIGARLFVRMRGTRPLELSSDERRSFLEDGDTVTMTGFCQGDGYRVGFGEVAGTVLPSLE